jgi:hypothetical protein
MSLDLQAILPNISHSLDGTGFLFGAGTSCEAGYPMMPGLTREVVSDLKSDERAVLDEVLSAAGLSYDDAKATPNIEQLADLVIALDQFGWSAIQSVGVAAPRTNLGANPCHQKSEL